MGEEVEDDREDICLVLDEYKLLLSKESNENTIKWMVFNVFSIINGLLITVYFTSSDITYSRIPFPIIGFVAGVIWFLSSYRTIKYHEHWKNKIRIIEKRFRYRTPFKVFYRRSKSGILGILGEGISSHKLMYLVILLVMIIWLIALAEWLFNWYLSYIPQVNPKP